MPEEIAVLQLVDVVVCYKDGEKLEDLSDIHKIEIHQGSAKIRGAKDKHLRVENNGKEYICKEVNHLYGKPEEIY